MLYEADARGPDVSPEIGAICDGKHANACGSAPRRCESSAAYMAHSRHGAQPAGPRIHGSHIRLVW